MSGDPPVCNAMHTPIEGAIDCVDWEASEIRRLMVTSQVWHESHGAEAMRSRGELANYADSYEVARQGRNFAALEGIRSIRQSITSSELRRIYDRESPAHPLHEDAWLAIVREGRAMTGQFADLDAAYFTAIATPNGLKWQYQGAVIID